MAPPEGFVADHNELSEEVYDEIEAVQFTITEVGSDLVPTGTTFDIAHNGQNQQIQSCIGILLTPAYANSRGFDVAALRSQGLIKDSPGQGRGQGQGQGGHGAPGFENGCSAP